MKIRLSDGKSTVSKNVSEFTSDNVGVVKLTQLGGQDGTAWWSRWRSLLHIKKKSPDGPGTMEVMVILLSGFVLCKR